jgi:uncharacterized protein (DUF1501 family)
MKNAIHSLPATRREFLRRGAGGIGLLAFGRFAPAFLAQSALLGAPAPEKDRTILVLVQLAGGNDGLNTVIPHGDDAYHRLRPTIGIRAADTLPLADGIGFHRELAALRSLYDDGSLAVVQNVGYPNPNRSHFRSTEIWETASDSADYLPSGWIGRWFDNACAGAPEAEGPVGIHVGGEMPQSFLSAGDHPVFGITRAGGRTPDAEQTRLAERILSQSEPQEDTNHAFLRHTMMDALVSEKRIRRILAGSRPEAEYPQRPLALALSGIAAMIAARLPTRVYFVSHGGFDTHANQALTHARLLRELAEAMAAFQRDLVARGLAEQVTTMTFSEFGRRPAENASKGTDHGTAAPLFVMGSRIRGGLHGTPPSLDIGPRDDLRFSTDFRRVYATVLDRWLGTPSAAVLGSKHEPMAFL